MILETLLKDACLTKTELADRLGISLKTVYAWKLHNVPKYAIVYLEQYIENRELKQGKEWMKRWLK